MTPRPRPDDAARAEELFTIYEAAWPEPVLRREWKTISQTERVMWIAVARSIDTFAAQAAQRENEACAEIAASHAMVGSVAHTPDAIVQEAIKDHVGARIATVIRARHAATTGGRMGERKPLG